MRYSDMYINREFINQMKAIQEAASLVDRSTIRDAIRIVNSPSMKYAYQTAGSIDLMSEQLSMLSMSASNCLKTLLSENISEQLLQISNIAANAMRPVSRFYSHERLSASFRQLEGILTEYNLIYYHSEDMSDEDIAENEEINSKIVTEIFKPDEKDSGVENKKRSAIIMLSPVNEKVLKYLAENPESFYQLGSREFENVMAEIYRKLGYEVELTKATRDGGKDIIIRKPEILGDFIYYVECKKYAANNPVGVGLVRELVGTVSTDRVNGGILATTSYFAPDAKKFITDNKYDYQIQMHDYDVIRKMLNKIV